MQNPASKSALYGHACGNCSKAKCRCIPREPGTCERCYRLGKVCPPSAVVRKPKKTKLRSRRVQLEEKLGDLVSLLQSQQTSRQPSGSPASPPSTGSPLPAQPSNVQSSWTTGPVASTTDSRFQDPSTASTISTLPTNDAVSKRPCNLLTPVESYDESSGFTPVSVVSHSEPFLLEGVSQLEAEEYLHVFRTWNLKYFPFAFIPESTSPAEVARNRPFLWLNVVAICTQSRPQQQALSTRIMEILGQQVLVKSERTIDTLLGLIAYMGWSINYTCGKPYLNMLSNIAMELASDLKLHMPSLEPINVAPTCFRPHFWPTNKSPQASCCAPTHTNEDRRVLLSIFLLYATFETARWALNLDEALTRLAAERESPSDEILVAAARIMQISEEASKVPWRPDDPAYLGATMLQIRTLEASLEKVKSTLSPDLLENQIVLSFLYSTEVVIHKLALYQRPPSTPYSPFDVRRIEYLNKCLQASKRVMDHYLAMEVAKSRGIHLMFVVQYSYAAQTLYRLSTLEDPDWDREAVKGTANIIEYLELAAARVEEASKELVPGSNQRILFTRGAESMRHAITIWAAAVDSAGRDENRGSAHRAPEQTSQEPPIAQTFDPLSMDFFDDGWLTDLFPS